MALFLQDGAGTILTAMEATLQNFDFFVWMAKDLGAQMKYNRVISSDIFAKREIAVRAKLEKIQGIALCHFMT